MQHVTFEKVQPSARKTIGKNRVGELNSHHQEANLIPRERERDKWKNKYWLEKILCANGGGNCKFIYVSFAHTPPLFSRLVRSIKEHQICLCNKRFCTPVCDYLFVQLINLAPVEKVLVSTGRNKCIDRHWTSLRPGTFIDVEISFFEL